LCMVVTFLAIGSEVLKHTKPGQQQPSPNPIHEC